MRDRDAWCGSHTLRNAEAIYIGKALEETSLAFESLLSTRTHFWSMPVREFIKTASGIVEVVWKEK